MSKTKSKIALTFLLVSTIQSASADETSLQRSKSIAFKKFHQSLKTNPQLPWTQKAKEALNPVRLEKAQLNRSFSEDNTRIYLEGKQNRILQMEASARNAIPRGEEVRQKDSAQNPANNTGYTTSSGSNGGNLSGTAAGLSTATVDSSSKTYSNSGSGSSSGDSINGSDIPKEMVFPGKPPAKKRNPASVVFESKPKK